MPASDTPPLGAANSTQRTCSRLLRVEDGREMLCGAPATEHIIYWWEEDPVRHGDGFDHGYACGTHWREYQQRWTCAGHHAINAVCGMPGSRVHPQYPCEFEGLPTAEPSRVVAREIEAELNARFEAAPASGEFASRSHDGSADDAGGA